MESTVLLPGSTEARAHSGARALRAAAAAVSLFAIAATSAHFSQSSDAGASSPAAAPAVQLAAQAPSLSARAAHPAISPTRPGVAPVPTPAPHVTDWAGSTLGDVGVECGSDTLALACLLSAEWGALSHDIEMTVRYRPLSPTSELPDLYTAKVRVNASSSGSSVSVGIFRLRPRTDYQFWVYAQAPSDQVDDFIAAAPSDDAVDDDFSVANAVHSADAALAQQSVCGNATRVWNGTFAVQETGVPAFDVERGRLAARLDGGGRPTWDIATLVYSTDAGGGTPTSKWAGLVSLDAEGFVVWYTQVAEELNSKYMQVGPFDQLSESHRIAYGVWFNEKGGFPWPDGDDDAYGDTLTGILVEVDEWGAVTHQTYTTCGSSSTLQAVTMHEIRALSADTYLVSGFGMHAMSNFTVAGVDYGGTDVASGNLNAWSPSAGGVMELVDLWTSLSPKFTGLHTCAECTFVESSCAGQETPTVDYMHISSAAPGTDGNFVVSLRNLNMIASLNATHPYAVQWLACGDPALETHYPVYRFASAEDAFYFPHHVSQLGSGRVLVMDNGVARPGGANYTRAVEYTLDTRTMTANLTWQFEYPLNTSAHTLSARSVKDVEKADVQSAIGNSVTKMGNGHYLVAFTDEEVANDDDAAASATRSDSLLFDVTEHGRLHAALVVKGDSIWAEGAYRVVPFESVYGEKATCPFA